MGSATSIPAAGPSVVSSAAAATTAVKGHAHHDQAIIPRLDSSVLGALGLILLLTFLASFNLVPVSVHMLLITTATVYVGSRFALKCWKIEGGVGATNEDAQGNEVHRAAGEQMQTKDAMMFPVIGSCVLFSLYCVYKFLPASMVNFVIKLYFFIFGCLVLAQKLAQILSGVLPVPTVHKLLAIEYSVPNPMWAFQRIETALLPVLTKIPGMGYNVPPPADEVPVPPSEFWLPLSMVDLSALAIAVTISTIYITTGSWACSNLFGIAFSVQGIEMLSLGSYLNGCILLCGLFIYDVFWVFGTDVMVTVAKSFDAPIKLLFPQFGVDSPPSMLGLGDIVIPGIFIALLLRYDIWRQIQRIKDEATKAKRVLTKDQAHDLECLYCHMEKHGSTLSPLYFSSNLVAYFAGLTTTLLVMYGFKAAQPALLYLVPACLGTSLVLSSVKGDFKTLWKYTENEEEIAATEALAAGGDVQLTETETKDKESSSNSGSEEATLQKRAGGQSSNKKRSARAD